MTVFAIIGIANLSRRLFISSFIKTQVMLYFSRLNSQGANPLVTEAYNANIKLHNDGIYSWYTFATNIFNEVELDFMDYGSFDKPFSKIKHVLKEKFKKAIYNLYNHKIQNKLYSLTDSSKLYLYSKLKTEIKLENYLIKETNFKTRQLITKFRVSDHNLEVEIGRYKNIPREQRTCKICTKDIDDEYHFFLNCSINSNLRINLFNNIQQNNSDFLRYKPLDNLYFES